MYNNIIDSCKQYMLIENNILNSNKIETINSKTIQNKNTSIQNKNTSIQNKNMSIQNKNTSILDMSLDTDTLFWSFFIILNGEHEYLLDNTFKREKEFKIESIEKLRSIKSELKAIKIRLNEIENELLNEKRISIKSLMALCLLYKKNIFYIWNNKYIEFINDPDDNINIIKYDVNKNYNEILHDNSLTKLNYYRENYWQIENINKPLKAIASYTRDELIVIVQKLEIKDISSKKTKKEMYEKILEKL